MREQVRTASLATHKAKTKAKQDYVNETLAFQEKFMPPPAVNDSFSVTTQPVKLGLPEKVWTAPP